MAPPDLFTALRKLRAALDSDFPGFWTEHVANLAQLADEALEHAQRDPSAAARNAARAAGVWTASAPLREAMQSLTDFGAECQAEYDADKSAHEIAENLLGAIEDARAAFARWEGGAR